MVAVVINGIAAKSVHDYMVSELCIAEAACVQGLAAQGDPARGLGKDLLTAGCTRGQAGGRGRERRHWSRYSEGLGLLRHSRGFEWHRG